MIRSIPKCYQQTRVSNRLHLRENPLRSDKPAGPFTAPANLRNGCRDIARARSSSIRTMRPRGTTHFRAASASHSAKSSGNR